MQNILPKTILLIVIITMIIFNYSFPQERTKIINGKIVEVDKCGFPIDDSYLPKYISPEYMGYSYDSLLADLEQWRLSDYVKIDSIGLSVQGRPLWQLTISSDPNDVEDKRVVHIHARTHPQETEGFYVTDEIIKILLSENNFAQTVRSNCVFYIVPMYNPDGVVLGYPRKNANNIDLEANWFTFPNQPEVAALKARFTQLMSSANPIEVMLNMHSDSDCARFFVCHDSAGTSPLYYSLEENFIEGIRAYYLTGILPWDSVVTWQGGNPLKYPESWFWLNYAASVMALTYEDMYQCSLKGNFNVTANAILHGVMDYMNIVTDVEQVTEVTPKQFLLQQNYPNPFNPNTKISWQSPISGHQTLKVYDVLGNEVATLVNEYRNAGSNEIDFNVGRDFSPNLASGIYFYRIAIHSDILQAGDFLDTKKMILLK